MQLVERHIISGKHNFFKEIDKLCFLSKNLYNAGLYAIRQYFFETSNYLGYYALQKEFQNQKQTDYYALPTKVSQQILMVLDRNFKSFFNALKAYKINPKKFKEKPKIPKYKHKTKGRNLLTFTTQSISIPNLKKGLLSLSNTNFKLKTKQKNITQVRLVPQSTCYVVEVVYPPKQTEIKQLNEKHCAGIDFGVNNLATVTSNKQGFIPFIINGRPLKSINHLFNQRKAEMQEKLPKKIKNSKKILQLTFKRNCRINDYLHKSSRKIIHKLVKENIGVLVIGKNKGWKHEIAIGKSNNQNFVQIPHARFIEMLAYKAHLVGIKVILTEESYTSKCSFLDNETLSKKEKYAGKRIKRGLFMTSTGKHINADVNGSLNIIRKAIPNAFGNGIEAVVVQPYRDKIL